MSKHSLFNSFLLAVCLAVRWDAAAEVRVLLHSSPEFMDPAKAASVVNGELKAWK